MEPSSMLFGRHSEQSEFCSWVGSSSRTAEHRAALLIGRAGIGKSVLMRRFHELCNEHTPEQWYVQRFELNSNESPSEFLERVLRKTHDLFKWYWLRTGPRDDRLLTALAEMVPKVGKLLAALVEDVKRPGWERFIDYAEALSDRLEPKHNRLVILIDPLKEMQSTQGTDWLTIASKLPPAIRIVIAQRPADVIAAHPESRLQFRIIPEHGLLSDLDGPAIRAWYDAELGPHGRLAQISADWPSGIRDNLWQVAFKRYRGHPFAHDAVIRLLENSASKDPLSLIVDWPPAVEQLMDMFFSILAQQEPKERLGAALALQVFSIPTPKEAWAEAAGLKVHTLTQWLSERRYSQFFSTDREQAYAPYHELFAERLERELKNSPKQTEELAAAAMRVLDAGLTAQQLSDSKPSEFDIRAAPYVATRFKDRDRLLEETDRVFETELRLGLLESARSHLGLIRRHWAGDQRVTAALYGNCGRIHEVLGELQEAEALHRKALTLFEQLGDRHGQATALGQLGVIAHRRGDLIGSEKKHRRALALYHELADAKGQAQQYVNLGAILRANSKREEAREMYQAALVLFKQVPDLKGEADVYLNLGRLCHTSEDDYQEAEESYQKALALYEQIGAPQGQAMALDNLGDIYRNQELPDLDRSETMHRKALELSERIPDHEGQARAWANLGLVYAARAALEEAREVWIKARDLYAAIGMPHLVAKIQLWIDDIDAQWL
jgi:tetratricopeptide (TPR) repeat protein